MSDETTKRDWTKHRTDRLVLDQVTAGDVDGLHTIHADPRVWTHFPSGRHTSMAQSEELVESSIAGWSAGLGYWTIREEHNGPVIGIGGCRLLEDHDRWNLYYRFAPEAQGRGYATELASAAVQAANDVAPDRPVVAYMLETNPGSWRVAEKIGLTRIWTGPDEGNPDKTAVGFVYADRLDVEL